ncbi:GNAT family N-acetyltransferase [Desulfovibrio aminophilus]|uniref:GNAT family N-acetyltransferase n=1 Tax=Desulfovibrio aminophilus TaxID=81425 RepID=UPI0033911AF0
MRCSATIRQARPEDVDALVELLGLLFELEADFRPEPSRQRHGLDLMLRDQFIRRVSVAELGGQAVGMATGQVVVSTAEGGPAALVEDVVVRPDQRGKGLGRALMEDIEAWAAKAGITRLQLLADRGNAPAFGFYASCGWRTTGLVCLRRNLKSEARTS